MVKLHLKRGSGDFANVSSMRCEKLFGNQDVSYYIFRCTVHGNKESNLTKVLENHMQ